MHTGIFESQYGTASHLWLVQFCKLTTWRRLLMLLTVFGASYLLTCFAKMVRVSQLVLKKTTGNSVGELRDMSSDRRCSFVAYT